MEAKKGMDKGTLELLEIGKDINRLFKRAEELGITFQDLNDFDSYLRRTETIHPLIAPMEAKKTFKMIDIAKSRVEIVRVILKQLEDEKKLKEDL